MVDNFKQIKALLNFEEGKFYFLQVILRKKDFKEGLKVNGTNNNSRLIKAYFIDSLEYLEYIEPEVKELCKIFNARAMIHLQKRDYEKIAFRALKLLTDNLINRNYHKIHKVYTSACGKFGSGQKYWIVDIDKEDIDRLSYTWFDDISIDLYNIQPIGSKVIDIIPSKSGQHIITKPFNLNKFKEIYPDIDVHKNNPVNIYIPS